MLKDKKYIGFATNKLKSDASFMKPIIRINPELAKYVEGDLVLDPDIRPLIEDRIISKIKKSPKKFSKEFMHKAVVFSPRCIKYSNFQDKRLVIDAINGGNDETLNEIYEFIKKPFRNDEDVLHEISRVCKGSNLIFSLWNYLPDDDKYSWAPEKRKLEVMSRCRGIPFNHKVCDVDFRL